MTRAHLLGWMRRLIELRALCELEAPGRPMQQARHRYERSVRLLVFQTELPTERIKGIVERFWVGWLRKGRTPAIRRAKGKAADRLSGETLRTLLRAGRDAA